MKIDLGPPCPLKQILRKILWQITMQAKYAKFGIKQAGIKIDNESSLKVPKYCYFPRFCQFLPMIIFSTVFCKFLRGYTQNWQKWVAPRLNSFKSYFNFIMSIFCNYDHCSTQVYSNQTLMYWYSLVKLYQKTKTISELIKI